MTESPPPRRKKRTVGGPVGCLVIVGCIALMIWGIQSFWRYVDERRIPWGYPGLGKPALVGTWVGTFTTGGGQRRAMLLDIQLVPIKFGRRRRTRRTNVWRRVGTTTLEGSLTTCGGVKEQHFEMSGSHLAMDASRFRLGFSTADSVQPDGLTISNLRGQWDQRDAIRFEGDIYMRKGISAITQSDDPDTGRPAHGTLARGDAAAFAALCAR